jgi:replicative DNA helicase
MGKTSAVLHIAAHVAGDVRQPVAIFSLEMSREQVVQRLLCATAHVESRGLRTGYLREADWPKLVAAAGVLSDLPIFIDDSPNISVLEMHEKARRLKADRSQRLEELATCGPIRVLRQGHPSRCRRGSSVFGS